MGINNVNVININYYAKCLPAEVMYYVHNTNLNDAEINAFQYRCKTLVQLPLLVVPDIVQLSRSCLI